MVRRHPKAAVQPLAVDLETAGQLLGIGRTTAYGLAASGRLPTVRVAGRRRVPIKAIEALLDEATAPPLAG